MVRGPSSRVPTAQDLGIKGDRAKAWKVLGDQYGRWWVRASNGEAFARLGDNPYGGPFQTGQYSYNWRQITESIDNYLAGKRPFA